MILARVPAVLTFAALGGVLWWGYKFDWKIPRLPVLLGQKESTSEEKKEEENKASADKPPPPVQVLFTLHRQDDPSKGSADKQLPSIELPSEEALTTAGIQTATVERQSVPEYVTAHGEVDFDQNHYAHLSARASGTAWSVHKRAGDQVKQGDVLALIACPQLAQLKFDLQQTLVLVQIRKRIYERLKSTGRATAGQALDDAESSLREANIRLSNERQSLQNLGLTIHAEELTSLNDEQVAARLRNDEQVAARLRTLGIPDSLLQRLDARTLTNNLLPMYAPFDGVVVKRDIVIGEVVGPSTPQFVLADLRGLWIMLHVRLEDAHKLADNQDVTFHLDGADVDAPPAKVTWVSPEVDEKTRTVVVRAEVPNPKGDLRPRTFGSARILVARNERLTVPNEALQFDGQSHLVFVRGKSSTEFQPVRVMLGPRHEKFTEIVSGVEAGQDIAIAGSHVLLSVMLKDRIEGDD
jgi:cobalt-zinc-cadmium efflux system membrane fusion protein